MNARASATSKKLISTLCVVYAVGAVLYSGWLAWAWISDGAIPDLAWWQHLLAPLGIVLGWLGMEMLGIYVANGFTFDETKGSKWRHILGTVGMFLLLAALIIGIPLYQLSK